MASDRTDGARPSHVAAEAASDDPIIALVRTHGCIPPYDAVDWRSVTARILENAERELERLRVATAQTERVHQNAGARARISSGARTVQAFAPERRARSWWEVTAGWARPAMMAVAAAVVVAGTLVATGSSVSPTSQASEAVASRSTAGSTATDGIEAELLGAPNGALLDADVGNITRDSLFTALVDGR